MRQTHNEGYSNVNTGAESGQTKMMNGKLYKSVTEKTTDTNAQGQNVMRTITKWIPADGNANTSNVRNTFSSAHNPSMPSSRSMAQGSNVHQSLNYRVSGSNNLSPTGYGNSGYYSPKATPSLTTKTGHSSKPSYHQSNAGGFTNIANSRMYDDNRYSSPAYNVKTYSQPTAYRR